MWRKNIVGAIQLRLIPDSTRPVRIFLFVIYDLLPKKDLIFSEVEDVAKDGHTFYKDSESFILVLRSLRFYILPIFGSIESLHSKPPL